MRTFPFILALFVLCFIAATTATNGSKLERTAGFRLRLTGYQLDDVGSGGQLTLTPEQKQRVLTETGKHIPYVFITYAAPDGELGELGYNLALRDRPDSVLILAEYALDESKIAAKEAEDNAMIAPMEKATKSSKESVSLEIDAQGRIWTLLGQTGFVQYVRAHQGNFDNVDITAPYAGKSLPLAAQDTLRFMKCQLKKAGAPVYDHGE